MQRQYNLRNPAVKRLMKEAQELREATEQYHAQPLDENLFEWHFTIRGPAESAFEGGLYHGRIILPPEYPMKPPSIILLTPNGRFEVNKKICLSISGYHPESWQPSWSIRTALLAIIGFMPTHGAGAIGSLDYPPQERKALAKKSVGWKCPSCGDINGVLPEVTAASEETNRTARELASQISFQAEKEGKTSDSSSGTTDTVSSASVTSPPSTTVASPSVATTAPSDRPTVAAQASSVFTGSFPCPPFVAPPWGFPVSSSQPTGTTDSKFGPTFPMPFVGATMPPMGFLQHQSHGPHRLTFPPGPWMRPPFPPNTATSQPQVSPAVSPAADHTSDSPSVSTASSLRRRNPPPSTSRTDNSVSDPSTPPSVQTMSDGQTTSQSQASPQVETTRQSQTTTRSPTTPLSQSTPQVQATGGTGSLILVAVLTIAIGLLLVRRLLITM